MEQQLRGVVMKDVPTLLSEEEFVEDMVHTHTRSNLLSRSEQQPKGLSSSMLFQREYLIHLLLRS